MLAEWASLLLILASLILLTCCSLHPLCPCCSYGFCPDPGSNPHDGCKLQMQLSSGGEGAAAHEWKAAALRKRGLAPSQLFPLRMTAAPFDLVHFAGFAEAEVGSQEEADALAQRLFGEGDFPPALQQEAVEAVVRACQAALKGYGASLEADRAELERLQQEEEAAQAAGQAAGSGAAGGGSEPEGAQQQQRRRRRQVLQVLVYERQVLNRTVFILQQELKDLKRMAAQRQ